MGRLVIQVNILSKPSFLLIRVHDAWQMGHQAAGKLIMAEDERGKISGFFILGNRVLIFRVHKLVHVLAPGIILVILHFHGFVKVQLRLQIGIDQIII